MMTFEQFQATRKPCTDLGTALSDARWEDGPNAEGNLYLAYLYIERLSERSWSLVLGNQEYVSPDLGELEQRLYDFAMAEGLTDV